MKRAAFLLIALTGLAAAEEVRPKENRPVRQRTVGQAVSQTPWLGLQVGPLDDTLRAHMPSLPPGFGFVVASVDSGGPAEKAGLRKHDILWKFDDQWIVNEAQIFALLRLKKEGDEVKLGIYRSGKEMTFPVKLAKMPEAKLLGKLPEEAVAVVPGPDVPTKELNYAKRSAKIEAADGVAVLSLAGGVAEVTIISSSGTGIFQGPVTDAQGVSLVPEPWKPRVEALQRALQDKPRISRPRVMPPQVAGPSGDTKD